MSGVEFAFLLMPSIAAVAVGYLARHWALAAAAIAGGLCVVFLVPSLPPTAKFLSPVFTGIAVAGVVMLITLLIRPDTNVWTRMTLALVGTFAAHLAFLYSAV